MTISAAIVGAGRMGKTHAKALARIDDVRLVGIADVREEFATTLASGTSARTFVDYREMLEQTKPDVVYLCTPATDHLEQVTFAAERGINVFVEKPLASSIHEAFATADVVEKSGILCSVGYQWRYNPATQAAREALADSPITMFAGWWYWTIPIISWIKDRRYGGGQVFDQCTHLIDLMRDLGGDIDTVYAQYSQNAIPQDDLPNWDANSVTMRFANSAIGNVHSTYALFPGLPDSNGLDVIARELLVRINLGKVTIYRRDQEPVVTTQPEQWAIDEPFIAAIRANDPSLIRAPAREAAKSVATSLAANYSATTGKVISLDDFIANPPPAHEIMPNARPEFVPTPV